MATGRLLRWREDYPVCLRNRPRGRLHRDAWVVDRSAGARDCADPPGIRDHGGGGAWAAARRGRAHGRRRRGGAGFADVGPGLQAITQHGLQAFLWHELARKWLTDREASCTSPLGAVAGAGRAAPLRRDLPWAQTAAARVRPPTTWSRRCCGPWRPRCKAAACYPAEVARPWWPTCRPPPPSAWAPTGGCPSSRWPDRPGRRTARPRPRGVRRRQPPPVFSRTAWPGDTCSSPGSHHPAVTPRGPVGRPGRRCRGT